LEPAAFRHVSRADVFEQPPATISKTSGSESAARFMA
jgi:hypothetical protein